VGDETRRLEGETTPSVLLVCWKDKLPLTSSRVLHKDVESITGEVKRPIIGDALPLCQLLNAFVVLFDVEATKRVPGVRVEINVDL
jgi:hypothetical protein